MPQMQRLARRIRTPRRVPTDPVTDLGVRLAEGTGVAVTNVSPVDGGHGARHFRARLADGCELFVKAAAGGAAREALGAEVRGLRWLAEAAAAPVPEVISFHNGLLAVLWVHHTSPDRAAAERFGRELARLHMAGARRFGAPWPGFIGSLPLPNAEADSWPSWYANSRLLPYCRLAHDAGTLGSSDVALIESVAGRLTGLAGPPEPPARIHGDCWSGNVLWSGGRGFLIDPETAPARPEHVARPAVAVDPGRRLRGSGESG